MSGSNEDLNLYTNAEAVCEALFFAAGESVSITDAANILMMSKEETEALCDRLAAKINNRNGGIILRKLDKAYQFSTKPELYENIRSYFEKPAPLALSRAASETLAVIAYMQPVSRSVIESVRGVNSDSALTRLLERGLVEEIGRAQDVPGRPMLYGTTEHFLRSAGIEKLSDLPAPEEGESAEKVEQMNIFEDGKKEE